MRQWLANLYYSSQSQLAWIMALDHLLLDCMVTLICTSSMWIWTACRSNRVVLLQFCRFHHLWCSTVVHMFSSVFTTTYLPISDSINRFDFHWKGLGDKKKFHTGLNNISHCLLFCCFTTWRELKHYYPKDAEQSKMVAAVIRVTTYFYSLFYFLMYLCWAGVYFGRRYIRAGSGLERETREVKSSFNLPQLST